MRLVHVISATVLTCVFGTSALAATCNPPGGFPAFVAQFKKDAAAQEAFKKTSLIW